MAEPKRHHLRAVRPLAAVLAVLCALLLGSASGALAQSAEPLVPSLGSGAGGAGQAAPQPAPSAGDIQNLIKTLDDDAARTRLKQQLQLLLQARQSEAPGSGTAPEPQPGAEQGLGAELLATISHHVETVSNALVNLVEAIADLPQKIQQAVRALADPVRRSYWLNVTVDLFGVLATAFIAALATRRLLGRARDTLRQRESPRWLVRLLYLPLIFLVEALPTFAFAVASYIALPLFNPNEDARLITSAIIGAQIASALTIAVSAALLAPAAPGLRLFHLTDESAAYLQVWMRRLAVVSLYGYALSELSGLIGIDPALHEVLLRAWGLLLAAMAVILVLQNRVAVGQWIAGGPLEQPAPAPGGDEPVATPLEPEAGPNGRTVRLKAFRRQLAKLWQVLAIAYVVAGYAVWSFQIEGGFAFLLRATVLTGILLLVVRLADAFLRQIFDRSFALPGDLKRLLPGLEARANRYVPVFRQTLLVLLYFAGILALLQVWGLDTIGWISQGSGRPVLAAGIKIAVVLLLAALLSEAVNLAIEHYLREKDHLGRRIYHSARVRTLLPLLRNAFRLTLTVLIVMVVLSEIGIDIAPLLAAAGVVGLAIGFGAQTLVKDIITGIFILLEDTLSIGDVVDLGGHAGVVEGMTIRTIRLRDLTGSVHTVPFSAVTTVQNLTKDFSFAVFEIGVAYKENVREVMNIIRQVGAEVEKDPDLRHSILSPIEILGLDSFQESAVVIKARIKTRPIMQWDVMRAFNLRLKEAFDRNGIEIPFPQQTIHVATGKDAAVLAGGSDAPPAADPVTPASSQRS